MRKSVCCLILLIFAIPTLAQINDIFIGHFLTFDPYLVGEKYMEKEHPGIENQRIFVWLYQNVPYDTTLTKEYEDSVFVEVHYNKLFTNTDSCKVKNQVFTVSMPMYFTYNDTVYSTEIAEFIYYACYQGKADIIASCPLPDGFHGMKQVSYFDVLCSTQKNMKIFHDKFEKQKEVDVVTQVGDYSFRSHLEDTGVKGHYDETVYNSFIVVKLEDKVIYNTGRKHVKILYRIGDFNGNGKIDLLIQHHPWDSYYWVIEFDGSRHRMKEYIIRSMC